MSEKQKRILTIVSFALSVIIIAGALYFVFFRPAPTPPLDQVTPGDTTTTGAFPPAGEFVPTEPEPETDQLRVSDSVARGGQTQTSQLTLEPVENPTLSGNGQGLNYYNPDDDRFYTIDKDGNAVALSNQQFPQAENVEWNKDSDKAIIEFPDGSNILYNFATKTQITLPKHWEDFDFAPTKDQFAAKSMALDPDNRWMVTSNDDGSNVKPFQALGFNEDKVIMSWSPNDQVVAFSDTAPPRQGSFERKLIIPIGKNKENYKGLLVEGLFFEPEWSPNGKQLLYSVTGDYSTLKPLLWVVDATPGTMGENRRSLGLNTWVDKCDFSSSTTVYCAVPQNLPPNSGLQRKLYENLPDSLYKVDLSTGRTTLVAIPDDLTTMENLKITKDESLLYFTNKASGRLESIKLK
ncbi:hypothetical protein ACFLZY_01830 [Patescibacteria group bacterium]